MCASLNGSTLSFSPSLCRYICIYIHIYSFPFMSAIHADLHALRVAGCAAIVCPRGKFTLSLLFSTGFSSCGSRALFWPKEWAAFGPFDQLFALCFVDVNVRMSKELTSGQSPEERELFMDPFGSYNMLQLHPHSSRGWTVGIGELGNWAWALQTYCQC